MPDIVITYDLKSGDPQPHGTFIAAAQGEGLLYVWKAAKNVHRLTDTTIWGVFNSCADANAAFDRALAAASKKLGYKIILEKRLTISSDYWAITSDKQKAPDPKWTGTTRFETSRLHQVNDPFFKY